MFTKRDKCIWALGALGMLQMLADIAGVVPLKGLAAATHASPAPKVFSAVRGLETFSSLFFLEWQDAQGREHSVRLTPQRNARIQGPYNRRNVYGAALAYGPVLSSNKHTAPMFESVSRYAFCGRAPLLRELDIHEHEVAGDIRIRIMPRAGANPEANMPMLIEIDCK